MATEHIKLPVRAGSVRLPGVNINIYDADSTWLMSANSLHCDEVIQALNGYRKAVKTLNVIRNNCSTCSDSHRERAYETLDDLGALDGN